MNLRATPTALHRLVLLLFAPIAWAQTTEVPPILGPLVKNPRQRAHEALEVDGRPMRAMRVFSSLPYLLWTDASFDGPELPRDREAVARWLTAAGDVLGHGTLRPVFDSEDVWLERADLWRYRLEQDGVPVWGYDVQVYWQGERLLGLVNNLLGPTASVAEVGPDPGEHVVLLPRRLPDDRYALEGATVTRAREGALERTTVSGPHASFGTFHASLAPIAGDRGVQGAQWTEWSLPSGFGSFPDQIDTDAKGRPWFSQPNSNQITTLNPKTGLFQKFPVTAGSGPDGMIVSSDGLVYSGLYFSGSLGIFDPQTQTHVQFQAPYGGAALAIPTETTAGTIVVTDHAGHVLEWDPQTQTWLQDVHTPTSQPHIVAGVEGDDQVLWFTEYAVNKLARFDLASGQMTEIPIPGGGGPAFPAYHDGQVWFSLWNVARMGAYDVASGAFSFYTFDQASELGGPFFAAPNGDIVCGTRNLGYVVVYRRALGTLESYKIPSNNPGLKDGLTVGADGTVWITESGIDKIARLQYPH